MVTEEGFPRLKFALLSEPLQDLLSPIIEHVGYFGDFFAVIGRNPEALQHFMEYTKAVKAPLSDRQNELLALVVCTRTGADYERIQHELLSQRLGFPNAWIAALTDRPGYGSFDFSDEEMEIRSLTDAILKSGGRDARAELELVRKRLGEGAALAMVLQIARFQMIACLLHVFDMRLPRESPLDR